MMAATVRSALCALAILFGVAGTAIAPATVVAQSGVSRPALPGRLAATTRAAIEGLADSLRRTNVPADPLYDKAAEGVLKGADDERILRAVRSLAGELTGARSALGSTATAAEILAGASALHAGVAAEHLRSLAKERGTGSGGAPLAVPLTVLADLVTRRVPPNVATASVVALIARGAADDDFAALRAEVQRDISSGLAPDAAAKARTQAFIRANPSLGTPVQRPH
jgi:hypothetical protein